MERSLKETRRVKRRLKVHDMTRKAIWTLMLKKTADSWAKCITAMERPAHTRLGDLFQECEEWQS